MEEDEQILRKLEEVIQKKKDEIAGLNRLLGFIEHPSTNESDSIEKKESNDTSDKVNH